jgi:hypothetical protein
VEKEKEAFLVFRVQERLVASASGNLRTYLGIPVVVAERTGPAFALSSLFFWLSLLLAAVENSFPSELPFILTAYITAPAENLIS